MTEYMPRSAWTSSGRGGAQLTGSKLVGIAWHWPGTSQNVIGVESQAATANRLRGYRNFHVGRGWSDIGYNFAIDQAGRVWDLRGLGRVGAHCASPSNRDANHEWMGVLLILGDRERPSAAMIRACQDFRADVFLARWPGRTRDTGHGRAPGVPGAQTSCPGPFAAELIVDGALTDQPQEDDMFTDEDRDRLKRLDEVLNSFSDQKISRPDKEGKTAGMRYALQRVWFATFHMQSKTVRWGDGKVRTVPHTLSFLQRAAITIMESLQGVSASTIIARLDEISEADAQRDEAILAAIEAIESGDSDDALAKLRAIEAVLADTEQE